MKTVIFPAIDADRFTLIQAAAAPWPVVNCESEVQALEEIRRATAFFGKMTPRLLNVAECLDWVQSPTASLEHYLFPELIAHPCRLTNMRGLFSDVIADHVLGYLLCIVRNLHIYMRQQMRRKWAPVGGETTRASFAAGPGLVTAIDRAHRRLADCTLGVIGVGAIGAEIARRAVSSGMKVSGVDPLARAVPGAIEEIWPTADLSRLLAASDFVVIAAPHTPATERLIGAAQLQQMRSTAWLINIGRGAIVNLHELTTALQNKVIAGAALDVFEQEPLPEDHPLWGMENVLITPHVAAASTIVPERHLAVLLENVRRYATGADLMNLVDKSHWF